MLAVTKDFFHRRIQARVEQGAIFRRRNMDDTVETAEVISVACDRLGIDHVRYRVSIRRGDIAFEEQRILSLRSFKERFREPVAIA